MAHLIDKDAVLAEIEELYNGEIDTYTRNILDRLKSNIDTLEVKEVDLDFTKEVDVWISDNGDTNGFFNVEELAKHFFELGMAVSNKTQKGE